MNRNSLLEMSGRAMHVVQRFTLNKGNDGTLMQELHLDGMNSEGRGAVERLQAFGFTSTPLPRDEQKQEGDQQGGGGGGTGGDGEQNKGPAAEGICLYVGGQRNHPVCIAVDDRRHRPLGLKPGENAQYDDQGQMTLLRRDGLFLLSLDDEGDSSSSGGGGSAQSLGAAAAPAAGGSSSQKKERMVSLRHVQKKKQERPTSGGGTAGEKDKKKEEKDYKHEGETVNTEIRATKNRIEFRSGDDVVGYYDKQAKRWCFMGEVKLGSDDASHPVYGVNNSKGMTTKTSGDGAGLVKAPEPGPPTSEDAMP